MSKSIAPRRASVVGVLLLLALTTVGVAAPARAVPVWSVGEVFITDAGTNNHLVKLVAAQGVPDGVVPGLTAPQGVAVDNAGGVFVADMTQVVKLTGPPFQWTVVGTGPMSAYGVAVDAAGDVYIADADNNRVLRVPADGGAQTEVGTGLNKPYGVAVDLLGDVYIADFGNHRIVRVPAGGGEQTEIGTGLAGPDGVAVDAAGDVFIADYTNGQIVEVSAAGAQSIVTSSLVHPYSVAVDVFGDLLVADFGNGRVVQVGVGEVGEDLFQAPTGVAVYDPPPTFSADSPSVTANVDAPYSYQYLAATPDGEPAATFAIVRGTLPPGLRLDPTTGLLAGIPTAIGTYTFTAATQNFATGTLAAPVSIVVGKGASTTAVAVRPDSITAAVSAPAPDGGSPSGNVAFWVDGTKVGSAPLSAGASTLSYIVSPGSTHQVVARYRGDSTFAGSSDSVARRDPRLTAALHSAHAKSHYGWFRGPVTVAFRCVTRGAALTHACPAPALMSGDGKAKPLTRTIHAVDGGAASIIVIGIKIDTVRPHVHVTGVHDGATYHGEAPTARCVARDALSGVASCRLTRHSHRAGQFKVTKFRAVAVDRAGNTAMVAGTYRTTR